MNGYTIENSIDLLEKDVKALKQGGGGGGASNWNQLQGKPFDTLGEEFYILDGDLTIQDISSDKIVLPDSEHYNWENVSEAVEGMNEEIGHINGDIIDLTTEINSLDETKQDTLTPGAGISITNNVISANVANSYSTEERVIGTWIDGKPLYRKVIVGDYGDLTNKNIDNNSTHQWKIVQGINYNNNYGQSSTGYVNASHYIGFYMTSGGLVVYRPSAYDNGHYMVIIEYTKTTD